MDLAIWPAGMSALSSAFVSRRVPGNPSVFTEPQLLRNALRTDIVLRCSHFVIYRWSIFTYKYMAALAP
jgi:hypothetical protein